MGEAQQLGRAPGRAAGATDEHGTVRVAERRRGQLGAERAPVRRHPARGRVEHLGPVQRQERQVDVAEVGRGRRRRLDQRPALVVADHDRPAGPEDPRRPGHQQLGGPVRRGGQRVEQFQLAVRLADPGVVALDRLDGHSRHRDRGADQRVRELAGRQLDDEVVDGDPGRALHHVDAEDVRAGRAERRGHRAEHAGAVRQQHAQQIGHARSPPAPSLPHSCVRRVTRTGTVLCRALHRRHRSPRYPPEAAIRAYKR